MLRIVSHIERLLLEQDCVILPGFGGFVLRSVSAEYQANTHCFQPMRREILFNGTLRHTDGLLSESYRRAYDVDYEKAQLLLEEDIEALESSLQKNKQVSLGRIGTFSLGKEGQVIFVPGDSPVFNATYYGLSPFHLMALPPVEEVGASKGKDVFYIPVSRQLIRTVVASAAAVALFFLVSTPVKEVSQSAYTASFVPTEMISYKSDVPLVSEDAVEEKEIALVVAEDKMSVAPSNVEETPKPVVSKRKKLYHVVIASFPTDKQAKEYISHVDRELCQHVGQVVRDGKYRVYADKFDNRAEAESYMETLRKTEEHKDAWLFISSSN